MCLEFSVKGRVMPCVALALASLLTVGLSDTVAGAKSEADRHAPGGPARLDFELGTTDVVPGAAVEITIDTRQSLALSRGRLELHMEPALFIDTPSIAFEEADGELIFQLVTVDPGIYVIEFAGPGHRLNRRAGTLLTASGIARPDLRPGDHVEISLSASVTAVDGRRVKVRGVDTDIDVIAPADGLVMHVSDFENARPGQTIDVVLSTYNPKPLSEGQVCLRYDPTFFSLVSAVSVQGAEPDVTFEADLLTPGVATITFDSPSASINRVDGPMIVVTMTLALDLPPGAETTIQLDTENSYLLDAALAPVSFETAVGEISIVKDECEDD